jgi:hypothetical protein
VPRRLDIAKKSWRAFTSVDRAESAGSHDAFAGSRNVRALDAGQAAANMIGAAARKLLYILARLQESPAGTD